MRRLLLAAAIALFSTAAIAAEDWSSTPYRIGDDRGGQIGEFMNKYAVLQYTKQSVILDGSCLSACTIVLGYVPRDKVCVTSRAELGFHQAWNMGRRVNALGQQRDVPVASPEGTALLTRLYPAYIHSWLRKHGGLKPGMQYLRGKELRAMFRSC